MHHTSSTGLKMYKDKVEATEAIARGDTSKGVQRSIVNLIPNSAYGGNYIKACYNDTIGLSSGEIIDNIWVDIESKTRLVQTHQQGKGAIVMHVNAIYLILYNKRQFIV
jgi:hypothetical protein